MYIPKLKMSKKILGNFSISLLGEGNLHSTRKLVKRY